MTMIGTILPTARSLELDDHYHATLERKKSAIGGAIPDCTPCRVGGETRYYKTETLYAVISSSLAVLWFDRRADGHDYAIVL